MNPEILENGSVWTYLDKDYVILDTVLIKDPTTRKWCKSVMYTDYRYTSKFCREEQDFLSKFKQRGRDES